MTENNNISSLGADTLAHQQVAIEENNIGIFFAAFLTQLLLSKRILSEEQQLPHYIKSFEQYSLYASQRVIIRKILDSKEYKDIINEMTYLIEDYNEDQSKAPHEIYLSKINKSFLIRQIFSYTDQTLTKYSFINNYINKDIVKLDLKELHKKIWNFPIEQQIMIIARIFIQMSDTFENKKKSIKDSFLENTKRLIPEYSNYKDSVEYINLSNYLTYR